MGKPTEKPSPRAQAIATGLVRTGRAAKHRAAAGFIRADGIGPTCWVSADGARVLRGDVIALPTNCSAGSVAGQSLGCALLRRQE
jgi:hypothetical protein